jgi:hypothetical protein
VEPFEELAAGELGVPGVTRRMMFGRDTLLADGHPYAFRDGERVAVKLPSAAERVAVKLPSAAERVAAGEGETPRMGSRIMRQWLSVPLEASSDVVALVAEARSRVVI